MSKRSIIRLSACPFCGALGQLKHLDPRTEPGEWTVECSNFYCGVLPATTPSLTAAEAIAAWNRRNKK